MQEIYQYLILIEIIGKQWGLMASGDIKQQSLRMEIASLSWFLTIWFVGKHFCCNYRGKRGAAEDRSSSSLIHCNTSSMVWGKTHPIPHPQPCTSIVLIFMIFEVQPPIFWHTAGDVFALDRWLWFCNYKMLTGKKSWETVVVTRL